MHELTQAYLLAEKVLDRPNADPDDDIAVLARQLVRTMEKLGICVTRGATDEERAAWRTQVLNTYEAGV